MAQSRQDLKNKFNEFVKKNDNGSKSPSHPVKQVPKTSSKDKEIQNLRKQLRQANEENRYMNSKKERQQKAVKNQQDDEAIADMEQGGSSNPQPQNVFDKTYHLSYTNPASGKKRHYTLHFVVRPASFADQNAIAGEVTMLTNRLGKYYEINNYDLVEAFANFRVLGIKVPAAFKDPHKLYRPDLLEMVYMDFLEWERNFRQYHMD